MDALVLDFGLHLLAAGLLYQGLHPSRVSDTPQSPFSLIRFGSFFHNLVAFDSARPVAMYPADKITLTFQT